MDHNDSCPQPQCPETVKNLLADVPASPGVYFFKDAAGRILYIGKAKQLKKRVASYFRAQGTGLGPKNQAMVAQIASLDTLSTATEKEALLLEASLIKKHKPRYNVVLRDDKSYILFKLEKGSAYPRLTLTRRVVQDGSVYYGPFTSGLAAKETWKAIQAMFPLRRCKDTVFRNRVRPCLYHQIGLCLAPCVLDVDPGEYAKLVGHVEMLLAGRSNDLTRALEEQMKAASQAMEYEKAAEIRDRIRAVQRTVERQVVVLPQGGDVDVLGLAETDDGLALGLLFVRQGRLLDKKSFFWPGLALADGSEALLGFLGQFYGAGTRGSGRFIPERIVAPLAMDEDGEWSSQALAELLSEERGSCVRVGPPKTGQDKQLVAMARSNALQDAQKREENPLPELLARRLGLADPVQRIEAVDISHTRGQETRAGLVVFEGDTPAKDQYRVYTLGEDLPPGDDYAALAAFARRRIESGPPWPDVLLIDGGKGQLAAVVRSLEREGQAGLFPLAAIAKEKRAVKGKYSTRKSHGLRDQVFVPGRKNPLDLKPGSEELLFLQRVRDSVHNFVIGRHRRARNKAALKGEVLSLPGVGPKTARLLWDAFPSVAAMAEAPIEELIAIPGLGKRKAEALIQELKKLKG